jgi:predicted RNA-binding protein with RPS1 domain
MTEHTYIKDGIKPQGKDSSQGNINLSPKPNEKKPERKAQVKPEAKPQAKPQMRPATKIDIDGTLVGRKVVLYVQTGNVANVIFGTIITMGSFWVVVKVEKTNIPFIHDVAYINKAYIIAYAPLPEGEQK